MLLELIRLSCELSTLVRLESLFELLGDWTTDSMERAEASEAECTDFEEVIESRERRAAKDAALFNDATEAFDNDATDVRAERTLFIEAVFIERASMIEPRLLDREELWEERLLDSEESREDADELQRDSQSDHEDAMATREGSMLVVEVELELETSRPKSAARVMSYFGGGVEPGMRELIVVVSVVSLSSILTLKLLLGFQWAKALSYQ